MDNDDSSNQQRQVPESGDIDKGPPSLSSAHISADELVRSVEVKVEEAADHETGTESSYFLKTISFHQSKEGQSESDEYQNYQSTRFGRRKIDSINTLEDVVGLIEKSKNILVLTGAGISCSAGIPDFRSENGLYAQIKDKFPSMDEPECK